LQGWIGKVLFGLPNIVIAHLTSFVSCQNRFELLLSIFKKTTVIKALAKNHRVARLLLLEQPTVRALRGTNRDDEGRWREKP
jgi:hypothetical protein